VSLGLKPALQSNRQQPEDKRPRAKRRNALKPITAFLFAGSLLMVSVVDPYSGNMVMAGLIDAYGPNSPGYPQNFSFAAAQEFDFDRGGFKVVTAGNKAALFVNLVGKPDPGTAKAYAYDYVSKLGWNQAQYSCLVSLWTRESQWDVTAYNKSSGAYGIPQALPGIKMASVGSDWQTNPQTQIRWGVNYIEKRYGTACGALAHSDEIGWY
jgi:hypothetical protein